MIVAICCINNDILVIVNSNSNKTVKNCSFIFQYHKIIFLLKMIQAIFYFKGSRFLSGFLFGVFLIEIFYIDLYIKI